MFVYCFRGISVLAVLRHSPRNKQNIEERAASGVITFNLAVDPIRWLKQPEPLGVQLTCGENKQGIYMRVRGAISKAQAQYKWGIDN